MDATVLIMFVLTMINTFLTLLASGLKYPTNPTPQTETQNRPISIAAPARIPFFARPKWVRSVSGSIALFLLYMLFQVYSVNPPITTRIVFYVAMLFAVLTLNAIAYIVFEISLRATSWIDMVLGSSAKSLRSEQKQATQNSRDALQADIKKLSNRVDSVVDIVRILRKRARGPLGDDEMDKFPYL